MNGEERAAALDARIADFLDAYGADIAARRAYVGAHRADPPAPSITCPRCGATSHHPTDAAEGYCGRCHDFTSPPGGNPPAPVS